MSAAKSCNTTPKQERAMLDRYNNLDSGEEPDWTQYDGVEVHPVADISESGSTLQEFEQCERDDPQLVYWSVYGHLVGGGIECIEDQSTEAEAMERAREYLKRIEASYRPGNPFEYRTKIHDGVLTY